MTAIKKQRLKAGFSQEDLAKALKVTQGAVSQWEIGLSKPQAEQYPKLAKILGCEINDLFDCEKEKTS